MPRPGPCAPRCAASRARAGAASGPRTTDKPDALHEGIPTFKAQGVDFVLGDLGGSVFVPRGTPKGIVDKIEATYLKVFANPELREQLRKAFIEADPRGSSEFRAILERWNPVLHDLTRELGLHVQR